jgi:hypothetical protein
LLAEQVVERKLVESACFNRVARAKKNIKPHLKEYWTSRQGPMPDSRPEAPSSKRVEWRYAPKHSSWLNRAESEFAILFRPYDRRIADRRSLERRAAAWLRDRNIHNVKADWRIKTADAHIKLKSLYPAL